MKMEITQKIGCDTIPIGMSGIRRPRKMRRYILIAFAILLHGCTSAPPPRIEDPIYYMDTEAFDEAVSMKLKLGPQTLLIEPVATFGVNNIPLRVQKWLTAIVKNDGEIRIQPRTRGAEVAVLYPLLEALYGFVSQKILYKPASKYDLIVRIDPETKIVQQLVFVLKAEKKP